MRKLLVFLSLLSIGLPAYADRQGDDRDGRPFDRLQEQVDKLRQRIQALEAASPAGQNCPAGQFVTGFTGAGAILCATPTAGNPTTPPGPAPIPASFQQALQFAFNQFAGQGLPLPSSGPVTLGVPGGTGILQPLTYDLSIGALQIAQTSATGATIQVAISNIAVNSSLTVTDALGNTTSGTITSSTSGTATINVTVDTTASGARRLGAVTAVDFVPGPISITGSPSTLASIAQTVLGSSPIAAQSLASAAEQILAGDLNQFNVLAALGTF